MLKHRMIITRIKTSMIATTANNRLKKIEAEILSRGKVDRHVEEDLCWIQREVQNRAEERKAA